MLDKHKTLQFSNRIKDLPGRISTTLSPENVGSWFRRPSFLASLSAIILLLLGGGIAGLWQTQLSPSQPIQFPHSLHLGFGIQCLYCHPGAWNGPSAGLPTETKCWGCHQQITFRNAELDKLVNYVQNQEPIAWVPVFILPDFTYFTHQPHVAAGVSCETCHGELSRMTVAQPRRNLDMGWCLRCHRTTFINDQTTLTRLTDCGTCHR
jgi:hypothetical protein